MCTREFAHQQPGILQFTAKHVSLDPCLIYFAFPANLELSRFESKSQRNILLGLEVVRIYALLFLDVPRPSGCFALAAACFKRKAFDVSLH